METIINIKARISNGTIQTDTPVEEITRLVLEEKKIVILKELFPAEQMLALRQSVIAWGKENPPLMADDFKTNYHCMRAKVSNIQQSPHVFHDYNFNNFSTLPEDFREKISNVFESLRQLYNALTGYTVELGIHENEAYLHPQLIQYPLGGGFFGRHNHNLLPQKIGFILSLSKWMTDYTGGGTCLVVNDKIVDLEGLHDIGELVLWRNDVDHWVKQTPLHDQFNWNNEQGRWVATLAYFNTY